MRGLPNTRLIAVALLALVPLGTWLLSLARPRVEVSVEPSLTTQAPVGAKATLATPVGSTAKPLPTTSRQAARLLAAPTAAGSPHREVGSTSVEVVPEPAHEAAPPPPPEVLFANVHQRWQRERKEAAWAPVYEHDVRSLVDDLALSDVALESVDCRATLCRIEIRCGSREALLKVLVEADNREGLKSRYAFPWIDGGHLVSYVAPLATSEG